MYLLSVFSSGKTNLTLFIWLQNSAVSVFAFLFLGWIIPAIVLTRGYVILAYVKLDHPLTCAEPFICVTKTQENIWHGLWNRNSDHLQIKHGTL